MSKPVTAGAKGIVLGKDEELKLVLHPHPLAFWKYDALAGVYLVSAGLLVLIFQFLGTNVPISFAIPYLQLSVWWVFLIIPSIIAGLLWVTKQPLIYSGLVAVVGTVVGLWTSSVSMLPVLLAVSSVLAIVLVEFYRRGHRYFVTNHRLVLSKRAFASSTIRETYYDRISDLVISEGMLGRIFDFGTIIPVSQAGLGTGQDIAGAGVGLAGTKRPVTVGAGVFGAKGTTMPRAATYYSLYGVPKVREVHTLISDLIESYSEAPILNKIEKLMEQNQDTKTPAAQSKQDNQVAKLEEA
jgi:Bacterial PH domain